MLNPLTTRKMIESGGSPTLIDGVNIVPVK